MNGAERQSLIRQFIQLEDGTLPNEQFRELDRQMHEIPEVADCYMDFMAAWCALTELTAKSESFGEAVVSVEELDDTRFFRRIIERDLDERDVRRILVKYRQAGSPLDRKYYAAGRQPIMPQQIRRLILGAAAVILFATGVIWLDRILWQRVGQRQVTGAEVVARLSSSLDARWSEEAGLLPTNAPLYEESLALLEGLAELTFQDGTTVICKGPADFTLEGEKQIFLRQGEMTVRVADGSRHFTVRSPFASVIDYGTEFGLAVDKTGNAETHVYEGLVELRSGPDPLVFGDNMRLAAGQAGRADTKGTLASQCFDAYRFVRREEYHSRQKAVQGSDQDRRLAYFYELQRDPDLTAYYTFDPAGDDPTRISNLASRTNGRLDGHWESSLSGLKPQLAPGRWPGRPALQLSRDRHERVRFAPRRELAISGPVTVAAWIRCDGSERGGHLIACRQNDETNFHFAWFGPSTNSDNLISNIVQIEAESGTLGSNWITAGSRGALGKTVITSTVGPQVTNKAPNNDNSRAVYRVTFAKAGEYDLYLRSVIAGIDTMDSLFVAADLGTPALSVADDWVICNNRAAGKTILAAMRTVPREGEQPRLGSELAVGEAVWVNWSASFNNHNARKFEEPVPTYIVPAPGTYEFHLAHREAGFQVDAIAFAPTGDADDIFVDADDNLSSNKIQAIKNGRETNRLQWIRNDQHANGGIYSPPLPLTGDWHFIAVTHDNRTVRFYLDGALVDFQAQEFHADPVLCDMVIGDLPDNPLAEDGHSRFEGKIDEVLIFKRAFSAVEMKQLYQQTNHRN